MSENERTHVHHPREPSVRVRGCMSVRGAWECLLPPSLPPSPSFSLSEQPLYFSRPTIPLQSVRYCSVGRSHIYMLPACLPA